MGRGWRLVADDRVLVWMSSGAAWGRAPGVLHGLFEVRGVGVMTVPVLALAKIEVVAECARSDAELDRTPLPEHAVIAGARVPLCRIAPLESAAPDKLAAFCSAPRV
jgi:serine kinase of HPr protein (carbohydrate metabolism regulator)